MQGSKNLSLPCMAKREYIENGVWEMWRNGKRWDGRRYKAKRGRKKQIRKGDERERERE